MDTAELFASEWQSLKEQRQQLLHEADQLKRQLNNLPAEPAISQLLEEKRRLKKKATELEEEVDYHQWTINSRLNFLERRRQALTDKRLQREFAVRVARCKDRIDHLKEFGSPQAIIQHDEQMIWEIEAPIADVEQHLQEQNAEEEQKRQAAARVLQETLDRIRAIKEHYLQTKRCLGEAIRETERQRRQLHEDSLQWASQDRDHLQWALAHEPSYRDDVIRWYRTRFPTDSLSDLLLRPTPPPVQLQNFPRVRQKKNELSSPAQKAALSTPPAWRFFVTFNVSDPGLELSPERDQFLSDLQFALHKAAYHSLDVQLVYDKVLAVTRMTTQQRQEMNKVVDVEPLGWKILRVGKKHRLFLSIDEDKCQLRFLPCPRKKSYAGH